MGRSVEIAINTSDKPDTGPVLCRTKGDQLRWFAVGKPYTVKFDTSDGTPFDGDTFEVRPNEPTDSGPVRSNAKNGDYHYNIHDGVGGGASAQAVDPKVIIKK